MKRGILYPLKNSLSSNLIQHRCLLPFDIVGGIEDAGRRTEIKGLIKDLESMVISDLADFHKIASYIDTLLVLAVPSSSDSASPAFKKLIAAFGSVGIELAVPRELVGEEFIHFCHSKNIRLNLLVKAETDHAKCQRLNCKNINIAQSTDETDKLLAVLTEFRKRGYGANACINSAISCLIPSHPRPDVILEEGTCTEEHNSIHFSTSTERESFFKEFRRELLKQDPDIYALVKRDMEEFNSKEKDFFHLFKVDDRNFLFEVNSRAFHDINAGIYEFLEAYMEDDARRIQGLIDRSGKESILNKLEKFRMIRFSSRIKGRSIETRLAAGVDLQSSETIFSFFHKNKCNLRCKYCFVDRENGIKGEQGELSDALMLKGLEFIVDRSQKAHIARIDYFMCGEMMLDFDTYKRLWNAVNTYAKESPIKVSLGTITNGTLLSDEAIEWFDKNNRLVGFSLDGGKETNDSMRVFPNGKGSFENVLPKVRKVLDLQWQYPPGVSVVLTSDNPDVLKNFMELWAMGFRVVTMKPARVGGDKSLAVTEETVSAIKFHYYRFALYILEQTVSKNNLDYLKAILNPFDIFGKMLIRVFKRDRIFVKRCGSGTNVFSVRNNGDLYPCDSYNGIGESRLGNILDGTFDGHVHNVRFVSEIEMCRQCWARYLCGGPCSFTMHISQNTENSTVKGECELTRYLLMLSAYCWSEIKANMTEAGIQELRKHMDIYGGISW